MATAKKKVFSGIQPTGELHLGNLVGALRNWAQMQEDYETYYCVVDLHAMTVPYDPVAFHAARLETAKLVMASGIDPRRSVFYFQSQVPQHTELAWVLSTITGIGQLHRMTQYKEKADRSGQNLGLLSYPVLMAADILIHKVHAVPVGDDQRQHLELTRDLVERFNHRFGEVFPVPERITPQVGARVMSLQDPTSKMSKSDPDVRSRLLLTRHARPGPSQGARRGHRFGAHGRIRMGVEAGHLEFAGDVLGGDRPLGGGTGRRIPGSWLWPVQGRRGRGAL